MSYRIMIISHAKFAEGIKDALEMIIGEQDFVEAYGLQKGQTPKEIFKEISMTIKNNDEIVILSDLIGGSMHNQAVQLLDRDNIILIGGINLSLVIQIALSQTFDYDEIDKQINESKKAFHKVVIEKNLNNEFFF